MTLELHPLCSLFPRMTGYDFECLKLDIKEHGMRTPITTYKNMILDGGNRYLACMELGINPIFEKFVGDEIGTFVLTSNLHRRHLSPSQSAAIVASVQDWRKAHAKGGTGANQHSNKEQSVTKDTLLDTTKDRAKTSGVGLSTQRKADAVAKANPELARKVASGEVSLNDATREVAPHLAPKLHVEPVEPPEPVYTELDEAHDTISVLQDIVSVGFMEGTEDDKNAAKELIASLRNEVKMLKATLAAVTISRDGFQRENAQMMTQMARQRKEIDKLKGK